MSLKSTLKGMFGEAIINVTTWLMLDKEIYHRINNVTLPLPDGGSTQIDHIIVSVYGIFVIETKNYKGWIFGSENQPQWTQSLYVKKYKFQNPLRQNYLHTKTLADLLELEDSKFHSVIMFIGECTIKTADKLPDNVMSSGLVTYIKAKQDKLLTPEQVTQIVEQIENGRFDKSWRTNSNHKAYLKDKHADVKKVNVEVANAKEVKEKVDITTDSAIDEVSQTAPNCPKCNSPMIKRTAKSGARQGQAFWGCTNFPKCLGVINITT